MVSLLVGWQISSYEGSICAANVQEMINVCNDCILAWIQFYCGHRKLMLLLWKLRSAHFGWILHSISPMAEKFTFLDQFHMITQSGDLCSHAEIWCRGHFLHQRAKPLISACRDVVYQGLVHAISQVALWMSLCMMKWISYYFHLCRNSHCMWRI